MAQSRTLRELGRFVNIENGGVIAERGTPYPCSQEQIDTYVMEPYCSRGNDQMMSEHDAIRMLENFLDPSRPPTNRVRAALHRIYDAMKNTDCWHPDVVIKAAHDIDTAFFMGRLKGNLSIQWLRQIPEGSGYVRGITHPRPYACSTICLSLYAIFFGSEFPRMRMWQVLFHEMIVSPSWSTRSERRQHANLQCKHAFDTAVCHHRPVSSYDRAQGWIDGHGHLFRRCLRAVEERTKEYFDGLCIASPDEDPADYRTLRPAWMS